MASLMDKLLKGGMVKVTSRLSDSSVFKDVDFVPTQVPMINVVFSGRMDGGIVSGTTIFAAKSKHFKTAFLLLCVKSFFDKYPEGLCLFYDSEFGAPKSYFESFGIDPERVAHIPVTDIEILKKDFVRKLETFVKGDPIIVIIDSLGGLASRKEVEDTLKEDKDIVDMTRTKSLKSFFRMITPHLKLKNIPLILTQHVYQELSSHPREIVAGGRGQEYAADNVFIIGRVQDKDKESKEVMGNNFIMNVAKSRFVKEGSKVGVYVSQETGINNWSGLLEVAVEGGYVTNESTGWYVKAGTEKKYREADTDNKEFWASILENPDFQEFVTNKFLLSQGSILEDLSLPADEPEAQDEPIADVSKNVESFEDLKPKGRKKNG